MQKCLWPSTVVCMVNCIVCVASRASKHTNYYVSKSSGSQAPDIADFFVKGGLAGLVRSVLLDKILALVNPAKLNKQGPWNCRVLTATGKRLFDQLRKIVSSSLGFRFLDLHIREKAQEMNNLRGPPSLLGPAKHQKCICEVGIEAHEDVPQSMSLWIDRPVRYVIAENTVTSPT